MRERQRRGVNWLMLWLIETKEGFKIWKLCAVRTAFNFRQLKQNLLYQKAKNDFLKITIIEHILKLSCYQNKKKIFFSNNTEMI